MKISALTAALLGSTFLAGAAAAAADEGMWTFDAFPLAKANQALGTGIDQAWLDRVRLGSVSLGGCSASLVSPQGLILTNQHCIRTCIQANASPGQDLLSQGVQARAREEELRCPGATAQVLLSIEDVNERLGAATAGKSGGEFAQARDAEIAAIEAAGCGTDADHRCQVVSLYSGGQYKLYRYRRYADVRLVYAPEHQAVIFGGDPDNFNFPRFALDAAFLRAYDDGRPAETPQYLRWNPAPVQAGQPVFISGNPGSTQRLATLAELRGDRDLALPATIKRLAELRGRLVAFAGLSDENARITRDVLRGTENNLKRSYGMHRTLADVDTWARLEANEQAFRQAAIAHDPSLADSFAELTTAAAERARLLDRYSFLEGGAGGGSVLYGYARSLVRAAAEREKPVGERLPGYSDAGLAAIGRTLSAARNIDQPLEALYLQFWLNKTREALGTDAPVVKAILGRESPEALGARLVESTRLGDPAVRMALFEGGMAAIQASDDPLIRFVLANDPAARAVLGEWRTGVTGPNARAEERLARARFAVSGAAGAPDATGTLRLSYGRVQGWNDNGREVAPVTTVAGLFERATGAAPFNLSEGLAARGDRLDRDTVFTIATTNDSVGGNSGSPMLNEKGEVIAALFDGNLPSLGGAYLYDPQANRAVAVTAQIVTEVLTDIYDMPGLVAELTGGAE
jgi:hypothetical protein